MAQGFRREGDLLRCQLDPVEQMLISSLIDELVAALEPPTPESPQDPLAVELGLTDLVADVAPMAPDNPVLSRLLPNGYDDPEAAAEFRKYTDDSLRRSKISDAHSLKDGLAIAVGDDEGWLEVDSITADKWLRAMNDLRLALGVQLEITADNAEDLANIPDTDPRHAQAMIYDFITWWQDGLVLALMGE